MTPVVEEIKLNSVNLLIVSGGGGDISEPPLDITPEKLLGIPF